MTLAAALVSSAPATAATAEPSQKTPPNPAATAASSTPAASATTSASPIAGAAEDTPSRSQYFTWINNTNEGAAEAQTLANLEFFAWLQREYGMTLDIYAFDAGFIDGARFYGSMDSARFKAKFPDGLGPVYRKAKSIGTRLGNWGGPDGFGETGADACARIEMNTALARDYEWALFKFDGVCGGLRASKADYFVEMMRNIRRHSPDLILLNHRLNLFAGAPYATTTLWEGAETYVDVHTRNHGTAPHNRAGNLARGTTPGLRRLMEDHGVCLSSCMDYWDDDLILQAFNRSLILAPEIYGNPWLLRDDEFPKLARIYNLHRKYRDILVHGQRLPDSYGPHPIARGDARTRLITLRNLTWEDRLQTVRLDAEIGLADNSGAPVRARLYHPREKILGTTFKYGDTLQVTVPAFRSLLLLVTTDPARDDEPGVTGAEFEVVKNVPGKPVEIKLLGMPGATAELGVTPGFKVTRLRATFEGDALQQPAHRKLVTLAPAPVPADARALYEAAVFAADNNALEARSALRAGDTRHYPVRAARDAFFNQATFVQRGLWDKNLFDGNMDTTFFPSTRHGADARIHGGCFRLELGKEIPVDKIVLKVRDQKALLPLLAEEGYGITVSRDLRDWREIRFLADLNMEIPINDTVRYFKLNPFPDNLAEVEIWSNGRKLEKEETGKFRANFGFAAGGGRRNQITHSWAGEFTLNELAAGSYLSVAVNGEHGEEAVYPALRVDGKLVGAPARAPSYLCNPFEYPVRPSGSNTTFYFPLDKSFVGKKVEVVLLGISQQKPDRVRPEVWLSSNPGPHIAQPIVLERK